MSKTASSHYLPAGLPGPAAETDGLSTPYWSGLRENRLRVQRCNRCQTWQFGPEWICHHCHAFDPGWIEVEPVGRIFSWERVWHPSHAALKQHGPYIAVLVELPHAGGVRMVGNLIGDPLQDVIIGADVEGVFEHHADADPAFSLLQWRLRAS
ncbi:OB-fold domain-containing protein [Bradyrhizobium genosp. L]|uniref:Zn-ribbon domain-containing OB-fold protein n=1 Tax=Bradyrhizobium genosp. L TaxID=83637 RepID=UPI0018A24F8F|nr:zinc ribbon domain-containing protein [Bradyrhizobium genosp. L]QPF87273.1 OB-fold domain-containing protein [Bradyrhizobium genosp. L]